MLAILAATFAAVFAAEIVGDKLIYTAGILATRYRPAPMMLGIGLAFAAKMAVAVIIGQALRDLPAVVVAAMAATSFSWVIWRLWRQPADRVEARDARGSEAAVMSFTTVFFAEWADVGQITAATMAAQFDRPLVVWVGAVLAMLTKAMLAALLSVGALRGIGARVSPAVIRQGGLAIMIIVACWSVAETMLR